MAEYNETTSSIYKAISVSGATREVAAGSIAIVAAKYDTTADPLKSVVREQEGVKILTAADKITFTTAASPAAGGDTYPETFEVDPNTPVILTAVAADGYTFDHWARNGASISEDAVVQVTVTDLLSGESSIVYTAVFTEDA